MQPRQMIQRLMNNISTVIVGKQEVIEYALIALLCRGHVLIEDVPGVGKTTLASALAKSLDCTFRRIQFTPDLMPSDVTGYTLVNFKTGETEYREGSVMSQVVLADEINRTSPKTQSALLEVMEEQQVTVDGVTHPVPQPFIVLERYSGVVKPMATLSPVCSAADVIAMQEMVTQIYCSPEVRSYVATIAAATRQDAALQLGASTRAAIALIHGAQACALLAGRDYIVPEDVQHMAVQVLSHRLVLSPEARMKGVTPESVVRRIIQNTPVPVKL